MEYKIVNTVEACKQCDKLLTELIKYEHRFDNLINENYVITSFYERSLSNNNTIIFSASDNNKIVGFIMARKEFTKDTTFKKNVIDIGALFIEESYRRKKIGTELINKIDQWAKKEFGDYVIEITAILSNLPAVNCYTSLGFKPVKITLRKE